MERETIEQQLFTWESWDMNGPMDLQFNDITLKVPMGNFPVGTQFPVAFLVGSVSMVILMDNEDKQHAFEMNLSVGNALELPEESHSDNCGCGHEHT